MRKLRSFALLVVILAVSVSAMAQRAFDVNLWDAKTPNKNGLQDTAYIKVFLPDAKRATGRAVVICPGGGYARLAMDHEGTQWAPFFNNMGIATIVLHYRMPNGNAKVPISDAEEALRTVRRNAKNWHINASDIGIMGFSTAWLW